jgi:hypothetical protein
VKNSIHDGIYLLGQPLKEYEELVCGESANVMLHEYHVITDVALMLLVTKIITSSFYCAAVSIRLSVVSITSKTLCRSEVTTFNCNYKKSDLKAFTFLYLYVSGSPCLNFDVLHDNLAYRIE